MDVMPLEKRVLLAVKRLASIVASRLRRAAGSLLQLVLHDQLGDLSKQTQRLGSASVESANYLGGELRTVDQRLSAIEKQLAELTSRLEGSGTRAESLLGDEEDAPSGSSSG